MAKFYITTAIDYSNADPHLGHALEKVGADALARYRRLVGDRVHFVIGMDEHGQKIAQAAEQQDVSPPQFVDRMAERFRNTWSRLQISYDDFIRTTEPRHERAVHALVQRMVENGDITPGLYEGYYCVGCEEFKQEKDLVEGRCPEHPSREIQWAREQNYFFRLSRYRDRLLRLLEQHPEFVQPEIRRNEIRNVVVEGLQDVSASRARFPWGIPFPGTPDHTVYVWVDALINYLSAVGFPDDAYREWWPADVHVIGKGVTRFHCIIWPAMLLSAGVELPRTVWAHGYITWGGAKISKSAGVAVTLDSAIDRYGPDPLRYFLLREVPWDGDGAFTWDRFEERYVADLANDLGNLAHRTTHMIERYRHGMVPRASASVLDEAAERVLERYRTALDASLLHGGLAAVFELVGAANAFIEEKAPWNLAKDSSRGPELDSVLGGLAHTLGRLAVLLAPFMPEKSEALWVSVAGREGPPNEIGAVRDLEVGGARVRIGPVLFPKPPTAA